MIPDMQTKVTPDPDVVCTEIANGDSILLHLGTQAYYTLNETGLFIWQRMSEGTSLEEISQALEARYDVSLQQARQSVGKLAADLIAEKLVSRADLSVTAS